MVKKLKKLLTLASLIVMLGAVLFVPVSALTVTRPVSYSNNPDILIKSITVPDTITASQTVNVDVVARVTNGNGVQGLGTWNVGVGLWKTVPASGMDISTWSNSNALAADAIRIMRSADIDADGDVDIISGDNSNNVIIWNNPGNSMDISTWASTSAVASGNVIGLATGDIDSDGDLDIISGDGNGNKITLWNNPGSMDISTWASTNAATPGFTALSVAVGDIDRDGDLDIMSGDGFKITLWNNPGSMDISTWASTNAASTSARKLVVGDIDADGDSDIVSGGGGKTVEIWNNPGNSMDISTWASTNAATTNAVWGLATGDIDSDGDLDIISGDGSNVIIWNNPGNSMDISTWASTSAVILGLMRDLVVGDIDSDGDLDIISGSNDFKVTLWNNPGNIDISTWVGTNAGINYVIALATGDIDSDGDLDIISGGANNAQVTLWKNLQTLMNYASSIIKTFLNALNQEQTYTFSWTAPATPGTYYLTAVADNTQKYSDVLQSNNRMTISVNVVAGRSGETVPAENNPAPADTGRSRGGSGGSGDSGRGSSVDVIDETDNTATDNVQDVPDVTQKSPQYSTPDSKQSSSGNFQGTMKLTEKITPLKVVGEEHAVIIKEIGEDSVTIVIHSDPITVTLKVGEFKDIDLNKDGANDLRVTLDKITKGVPDLLITSLEKTGQEQNENTNLFKIGFYLANIMAVSVVIILLRALGKR